MAIKRPAKYKHNNPNLPIVDVDNVWGGMFIMTGSTEQERFNIPQDKLKSKQLVKDTNGLLWELIDINNNDNSNGWSIFYSGETNSSYWTAGTGIYSGTAITTIANRESGGDAFGINSVAFGQNSKASGDTSTSFGKNCTAYGKCSKIGGYKSSARGDYSNGFGYIVSARGRHSHAEGYRTIAGLNDGSENDRGQHAEGGNTKAFGRFSHAGGSYTTVHSSNGFAHASRGLLTSGATNSILLGGDNLTGTSANTVYVPYLNVNNIHSGTSIINLGLDTFGNVVTGISESNSYITGQTLNGNTLTTTLNNGDSLSTDFSNLSGYSTTDNFVTGGTLTSASLILHRQDGNTSAIDLSEILTLNKYANNHTFSSNIVLTVNHNLNDTDIIVQLKNSSGNLIIPKTVNNYLNNSVDVSVSTGGNYRVIIKK